MWLTRILLGLLFFGLWWTLSGYPTPLLLGAGAVTAGLIAVAAPWAPAPHRSWFGWIGYVPWLLQHIVLANLHVAKRVCQPLNRLAPRLITHRTPLRAHQLRIAMAQSITLTPGTITIGLDESDGTFMVHTLDDESAGDLVSGALERALAGCSSSAPPVTSVSKKAP